MASTSKKQSVKKVLKIVLIGFAVLIAAVTAYRYYNRPVQTWQADAFEGRNPDKVATKGQGQRYWSASTAGNGFYITDEKVAAGEQNTYCVSGAVGGDSASFTLGDASITAKNGYYSECVEAAVNDKQQLNFAVTEGSVQVFSVARKR